MQASDSNSSLTCLIMLFIQMSVREINKQIKTAPIPVLATTERDVIRQFKVMRNPSVSVCSFSKGGRVNLWDTQATRAALLNSSKRSTGKKKNAYRPQAVTDRQQTGMRCLLTISIDTSFHQDVMESIVNVVQMMTYYCFRLTVWPRKRMNTLEVDKE